MLPSREKTNVAYPSRLVMCDDRCDYCDAFCVHVQTGLHHLHGIKSCDEHIGSAQRDLAAHLHDAELVDMEDFIRRFPHLATLGNIQVPRTDGSCTGGARVVTKESPLHTSHLVKRDHTIWYIPVKWENMEGKRLTKLLDVRLLDRSGVDVEPLLEALSTGFYTDQHAARQVAFEMCGGHSI